MVMMVHLQSALFIWILKCALRVNTLWKSAKKHFHVFLVVFKWIFIEGGLRENNRTIKPPASLVVVLTDTGSKSKVFLTGN